jgi:hypothetical protein
MASRLMIDLNAAPTIDAAREWYEHRMEQLTSVGLNMYDGYMKMTDDDNKAEKQALEDQIRAIQKCVHHYERLLSVLETPTLSNSDLCCSHDDVVKALSAFWSCDQSMHWLHDHDLVRLAYEFNYEPMHMNNNVPVASLHRSVTNEMSSC